MYAAYNDLALEVLAGKPPEAAKAVPAPDAMTLRALAEACRDEWWPAKGRSPDVAEQYYQKLRDYVFPVLGKDKPIGKIVADDWDRVLAIHAALDRHAAGDWSDLCDEDRAANERALIEGERLLSSYETPGGATFWIITERDRLEPRHGVPGDEDPGHEPPHLKLLPDPRPVDAHRPERGPALRPPPCRIGHDRGRGEPAPPGPRG